MGDEGREGKGNQGQGRDVGGVGGDVLLVLALLALPLPHRVRHLHKNRASNESASEAEGEPSTYARLVWLLRLAYTSNGFSKRPLRKS